MVGRPPAAFLDGVGCVGEGGDEFLVLRMGWKFRGLQEVLDGAEEPGSRWNGIGKEGEGTEVTQGVAGEGNDGGVSCWVFALVDGHVLQVGAVERIAYRLSWEGVKQWVARGCLGRGLNYVHWRVPRAGRGLRRV